MCQRQVYIAFLVVSIASGYGAFIVAIDHLLFHWYFYLSPGQGMAGSAQVEARCGKTARQNETLQNSGDDDDDSSSSNSSSNQKHLHRLSLSLHSISNIHVLKYQSKRYTQNHFEMASYFGSFMCLFYFCSPPVFCVALGYHRWFIHFLWHNSTMEIIYGNIARAL